MFIVATGVASRPVTEVLLLALCFHQRVNGYVVHLRPPRRSPRKKAEAINLDPPEEPKDDDKKRKASSASNDWWSADSRADSWDWHAASWSGWGQWGGRGSRDSWWSSSWSAKKEADEDDEWWGKWSPHHMKSEPKPEAATEQEHVETKPEVDGDSKGGTLVKAELLEAKVEPVDEEEPPLPKLGSRDRPLGAKVGAKRLKKAILTMQRDKSCLGRPKHPH